jgi:hypothetical protein
MSEKGSKPNYGVSAERFVEVWTESTTASEVAAKLGMPRPIVLARACGYRRAGVFLKKLEPKVPGRVDVAKLNRIVQQTQERLATPEPTQPPDGCPADGAVPEPRETPGVAE